MPAPRVGMRQLGASATARSLAEAAVELVWPRRCIGCGAFGAELCTECLAGLRSERGGRRCAHCSAPWEGEDFCPLCTGWQGGLDEARCAYAMGGLARRIVHGLKYARVTGLASTMAAEMAGQARTEPFDVAYAVPLHRSRQRTRGFNQAELLLRHLELRPGPGTLARTRKTRSQVGRSRQSRLANMAGAFRYTGPELDGARVAIIDDVVTTGATANECARVLRDYGASRVVALAFARADWDVESGAERARE